MRIAIVAPSPVPFVVGGAENLCWGLERHINQLTPHEAQLVKLPGGERNLLELVDSYRRFSLLDLSHFDLVISTKYPAWMIDHPHHVCWLLHRLRGLYDAYHLTRQQLEVRTDRPELESFQDFMRRKGLKRGSLPEFFERFDRLRQTAGLPADTFAFPGPLAREVVHFLDGVGLAPTAIARYAAISHNVARRPDYFPLGSAVEVIYPPSNLDGLRCGRSDYLFTASRLDGPKRIDLVIEAMRHVKSDVPLKIAGTGPEADRLRELAAGDQRIGFVGFVNDAELVDLYADALAVPYVPCDEDYGLITVEAMMSGKPVLTAVDSGGPNELVRDGETGFSVAPDPRALAERIDYLCQHPGDARRMGSLGRRQVEHITWNHAVARLAAGRAGSRRTALARPGSTGPDRRRRWTVASTYHVFPPRGGGQCRVYHLYRHLAQTIDIDLVTLGEYGSSGFAEEIAPGLREIRVPKSAQHARAEARIHAAVGVPITDVAMPRLCPLTPDYLQALSASAAAADLVVAAHPYLLRAIRHVTDKPIWYDAHNVEWELKKRVLPANRAGRELVELTREIEDECCRQSQGIMTCSAEDADVLAGLYGADRSRMVVVPNGVEVRSVRYVAPGQRAAANERLGLAGRFLAVFVGSWHGPNLDAVKHICGLAPGLADVAFLVVGSACLAFRGRKLPANVGLLGELDDDAKDLVLSLADVALNPMAAGSGTNLKMLEYFAAGVPVISTLLGARGLQVHHERHLVVADGGAFAAAIRRLQSEDPAGRQERVEQARKHVEEHFDWTVIARNFLASGALAGVARAAPPAGRAQAA